MNISEIIKVVTGKDIKKLETGSECELAGEIAFQYHNATGEVVVLDVDVNKDIDELYINRMLDLGIQWEGRKPLYYKSSAFFSTNRNFDSLVVTKTVEDWTFNRSDNVFENGKLEWSNGAGFIPFIASFIVDKFITGTRGVLHFVSSAVPNIYTNVFVLMYNGNKLIKDIISIENISMGQAEWFAFIAAQRQCNRMLCSADSVAKAKWFKDNDVRTGDVLLLYTIGKNQDKTKRELQSCFIGVVTSLSNMEISMSVIYSIETVLTQVERVSTSNILDKSVEDYTTFGVAQKTIQFTSLGCDYLTYDEEYMVMKPSTDDGSVQLMVMPNEDGEWDVCKVEMDTLDTIYAVLKNRGIKFNEERFLKEYFEPRGVVPIYARYASHQPTKYENMSKAELLEKYGG